MRFLRLCLLVVCGSLSSIVVCRAEEGIRFARTPDISPDGRWVAFSYLGDIWLVPATGGLARPITMHEKHEFLPAFSPDGKWLAFSSNRHGRYDVFVVPVQGGRPKRLTFDSADEYVCGWTPDSQQVLFWSDRGTDFPPRPQLYTVPLQGGEPRRVSAYEGRDGAFSPRGDLIAYVRGPGQWYRQGYRGSANDDIWICNADGSHNRRLTAFPGQDGSPCWAPDGRAVYYVTEYFGTPANIVRQEISLGPDGQLHVQGPPQQLTFHKEYGVRRARLSANGDWLVYECGPDLWLLSTKGGAPRKLFLAAYADDKTNPETIQTFTSGAAEFAVSPNEKYVAFALQGEIFVMPISGGPAKQLTHSPAYDHGIAWSPDSRQLAFLSDRDGSEDIYLLESEDAEHLQLLEARKVRIRRLTHTPEEEIGVSFSPDGKRLAFLRDGKLWTMKPDGSDERLVVPEPMVIDYEWSPDSRWLCYARLDGTFASELYIVPATGPTAQDPPRNITRYATFNADVTWSRRGQRLAFLSERRGGQQMYVLELQKPPAPHTLPGPGIDWEDIHLRAHSVAPMVALHGAISPDGTRVAFRALANGDDLWVASADGKDLQRLTQGNLRPMQIHWSTSSSQILYFKDGQGMLRKVTLGNPPLVSVIPFQARLRIHRDEQFAEIFEQSWRALYENFYDPNFHGVDWKAVREKYRPLVRHVALKEDLYDLIRLMFGELNASHLGIGGPLPAAEETTADLGLLWDEHYRGPGRKIAEVLARGPADRRGLSLKPGDIVWSIDDQELNEHTPLAQLLNGKVGQPVVLEVSSSAAPKSRRRVELVPASRESIRGLMYERWVAANARRVAQLSGGRLGYIHIPSMDDAGLDRFVRALYSDNFDKDGIVLDVRYNNGGFTHDRVLNYLGGKEHTFFVQRHGGRGPVLRAADRKWSKPLVLLINNRSYSDAEIFPNAFRTLGLGKLVGEPTGGMVIGTTNIQLVDGSFFRVPRTGVYTRQGVNMEKQGVMPDVFVEAHPDQLARGEDPQLERAVAILAEEVLTWKKAQQPAPISQREPSRPAPGIGPHSSPASPAPLPKAPAGNKS
jgi:tricorn protease